MKKLTASWAGRLALTVAGWSALGLLFALPMLSAEHWRQTLLGSLGQWWSWGLVAPLIAGIDRRLPFSDKQLGRRIVSHLVPSAILTAAYLYVFAAVRIVLGMGGWSALFDARILVSALHGMFLWSWLVYWLIFGALQVFRYYEHYLASELRLERLERNFSEARLNALRMQLDPHFLFNALNTISSQTERDPKLARRMIEHLGDLLRLSLESKNRHEVPLAEEMGFLEHYLAIQKIRFGESLRIETRIAPEVRYASVPCLFVQPLVENAIRHGIAKRAAGGSVVISAERVDGQLEIRVLDDGVGLPAGWTLENSAGVGLSVTRERVAGLHPNGGSRFAVRRHAGGGTEVAISLPLRVGGGVADGRADA